MKNFLLAILIMLTSTLMIAIIPTEAEAAIYEDTVRLHILAASDSAEDQGAKLKLRDTLLERYSDELGNCEDIFSAKSQIYQLLPEISGTCNQILRDNGYDYIAKAELCEEWYNTREYKDFSLPQGYYTSLKITIGEGDGANWWCVMYPPMCLDIATSEAEYTDEEYRLISPSGYRVKFKLLELASELTRKRK